MADTKQSYSDLLYGQARDWYMYFLRTGGLTDSQIADRVRIPLVYNGPLFVRYRLHRIETQVARAFGHDIYEAEPSKMNEEELLVGLEDLTPTEEN